MPGSGFYNIDGSNQEHSGCVPDVAIDNTPADILAGKDAQLEKAVSVLMDQLKNKSQPQPGPVPTPTAPQKEGDFSIDDSGFLLPDECLYRSLPWMN